MAARESTTSVALPQIVRGADPDRRAVLYSRVSTANGQDPEVQSRDIREHCQRRGWPLVDEYVDIGISGAKERRPQLDRLIADAHKRKFEVIVVWRFDRFARSVSHLLRALENFRALGIEFVSLSEQIDTSTPTGKMIFTVLGAVAELERSLIAERVRAGLRNARAKGKHLGRPRKGARRRSNQATAGSRSVLAGYWEAARRSPGYSPSHGCKASLEIPRIPVTLTGS